MSNSFVYTSNSAKLYDVVEHLKACNQSFIPALSSRCEINKYAHKLLANSTFFEAWDKQLLIGLIAIYCNRATNRSAYISNVSVLPKFQGNGIGTRLLLNCTQYTKRLGYRFIDLNVDQGNSSAISLYVKHGFKLSQVQGSSALMRLCLAQFVQ